MLWKTSSGHFFKKTYLNFGSLGIFLFLLGMIIRISWYGFSKSADSLTIGLSAGLLAATIGMMVSAMTAEVFLVVKSAEIYWVGTALTMAILANRKREKSKGTTNNVAAA